MGMLLVDKPAGITSHDVVAVARRALKVRKAGHAGTLDPFATGLLVLGIGRATRLLEYLVGLDKEYEATARLGVATDSQDPEGEVVAEDDGWRGLAGDRVRAVAEGMVGRLRQSPPVYSAVKVGGVAAHRRVRRGESVELPAREVTVRAMEVLGVDLPEVRFRVACSSGTYVRSLGVELGDRLGTACHLVALRRTRVGGFDVRDAATLEVVRGGGISAGAAVDVVAALAHLPRVVVDSAEAAMLATGKRVAKGGSSDCPVAVFTLPGDRLVAVGAVRDGVLQPRKVFHDG